MRPITKLYRELASGTLEEEYQEKRKRMRTGTTISSLAIPFAVAGFLKHEPRLLNGVAAVAAVGATFMGFYLLRRNEGRRHEGMMALLRKEADRGNFTAQQEVAFHTKGLRKA